MSERTQHRSASRLLLALLAAACAAPLAAAGADGANDDDTLFDLSLDQLRNVKVLTATKTATPLYATPAVVTLVTADDIARYGYQTLAEALSHVAGFVESDDRLNHNFGVRGINAGAQSASRAIKILLDGQPIAFRSTQQQLTGLEFIPLNMVERIEIVRGPVSVLYGADALLGAINVITRRDGSEQRLGLAHEWSGGGRSADLLSASGSVQLGATEGAPAPYWLAWGLQAAKADRSGLALPRISPDYQRYAALSPARVDDADPRSLYLRGGWRGASDELQASAFWQRQDSDNVYANLNPLLRPPSHVVLEQGFVHLEASHRFNEWHTLRASLNYGEGEPGSGDIVRTGAADYYLLRDFGYQAVDGSAEWLWQPGPQTSLLLGADLLRDRETLESFRRHSLVDGSNFQLSQPGEKTLRNTGLYAQWQFPLVGKWQAILGGRQDRHSVYGTQESLRAGVVGTLPGDWGLKVLGGTAFQAPSAELLYRTAVQPGDVKGNPNLAPQKSRTLELQLSTPSHPHWNGALTVYHTKVSELVTLEQEFFNLVARNSSDSKVNGVELELRYQRDWLNAYANLSRANGSRGLNRYTLAPLAQRSDGELFPTNSANAGASASLMGQKLLLSLDNRYVGRRPAATSNVLLANQAYHLASYVDTTLGARWSINARSSLRLQVRDLWNSRYVDPGVGGIDYPSLGRRYGVQYEYRY
ncbi:TonB-dependent receptor plug domain-containing protein [Duganella violaceipulchra]|uniref:Iron complex outermembrane receptor protein n=1 Tax=Duganella violaceipulchra TaxID=2849652 RepID=A0AA41HAK9_9BURK|nr:TonB-dependent receptor [Duganella violaceicalia]MBV6325057.1 TonB-dependent receptor [Duganella violaceicalia]MCP2010569.1 iron complex outermembrane receptor protein [Duganella violaceicalia]